MGTEPCKESSGRNDMKTPQKEAKELAKKCALATWGGTPTSEIGREIVSNDQLTILNTIPLTELIAVARAAARIGRERIEFEGSEHYAVVIEEVDELDNALQTLRATGKVEL